MNSQPSGVGTTVSGQAAGASVMGAWAEGPCPPAAGHAPGLGRKGHEGRGGAATAASTLQGTEPWGSVQLGAVGPSEVTTWVRGSQDPPPHFAAPRDTESSPHSLVWAGPVTCFGAVTVPRIWGGLKGPACWRPEQVESTCPGQTSLQPAEPQTWDRASPPGQLTPINP